MEPYESLIEKQIRAAMEQGAFDNLPGRGKPLADLDQQLEPGWWAARVVRRERSADRARQTRESLDDELNRLWRMPTIDGAAAMIDELNARLQAVNADLEPGDRVSLLVRDATLAKWERLRQQRNRRRLS